MVYLKTAIKGSIQARDKTLILKVLVPCGMNKNGTTSYSKA